MEGGKPEKPEKNPLSKDENQQQTQPTYGLGGGSGNQTCVVRDESSHHDCSLLSVELIEVNFYFLGCLIRLLMINVNKNAIIEMHSNLIIRNFCDTLFFVNFVI